jgi:2-polyprenyl-3-methyl-5-hydroxy-6-metoxy-1,4-benzoquinol methylase
MALPFGWQELADLKPGELMDVGCGAGTTLALASQLGWSVRGLEMDAHAVRAARAAGVDVQEGGFERLSEFRAAFDCINCSHVIEHVFDPVAMIHQMHSSLRRGGVLLLATPNSQSDVHRHFGKHWRGLEAPRHLVLFTEATLTKLLLQAGFSVESRSDQVLETTRESARIANQRSKVSSADRKLARRLTRELDRTPNGHDFIKIVARKE